MKLSTKISRYLCFALVCLMLFQLSGCMGKGKKGAVLTASLMKHAYKAEYVDLSEHLTDVNHIYAVGDMLYIYGYFNGDQTSGYSYSPVLLKVGADGSGAETVPIGWKNNGTSHINYFSLDSHENIWYVEYIYQYDEGIIDAVPFEDLQSAWDGAGEQPIPADDGAEEMTPDDPETPDDPDMPDDSEMADDPDMADDAETPRNTVINAERAKKLMLSSTAYYNGGGMMESPKEKYILTKLDSNGNELLKVDLGEFNTDPDNYFSVNSLAVGDDGTVYIVSDRTLMLFDNDMNFQFSIETDWYISEIIKTDNGKMLARYYAEKGEALAEIDMDAKALNESEYSLPGAGYRYYNMVTGEGYDLYLNDSNSIYGYNFGEEPVEILNWIDSDIDSNNVNSYAIISAEKIVCIERDYRADNPTQLIILTKLPPEEVKEKRLLTFASNFLNYEVKSAIINFNKKNDKYRIQATEYSTFNTEEDYTLGIQRMNTDIISGKIPDIIQIDPQMPLESYVAKGIFKNIYDLMDKEEGFHREDYFQSLFLAYEIDGKLYQIMPTFNVFSVVGKTSDVGETPGWTIEDLTALLAKKPEGTKAFRDITKKDILIQSLFLAREQFIDKNTGICSFNSDAFLKLLEFSNQSQSEMDYDNMKLEYDWQEYEAELRNGKTLLEMFYLYDFDNLHRTEAVTFGEPVTFIGFPTANKNGSAFMGSLEIALSAKSKNIDGAWEFAKYFLSDDYQKKISYSMPAKISRFEEMAKEAMTPRTYVDENGETVEIRNTYWQPDGGEIDIGYVTQDDVDQIRALIDSTTQVMRYDQTLNDLVTEEAEAYFMGQKTAAQVADIIQNRAQIYISENR